MRVNDIVSVHDGSYSMSLVKGILKHTDGISLQKRSYRVNGISGMYPTERTHRNTGTNDTLLVDVKDSDFVLFTQERFCTIVTPPAEIKVVIPRGTKSIHLILPQEPQYGI